MASDSPTVRLLRSGRAGGEYAIDSDAEAIVGQLEVADKAKLTTWLVDQRSQGVELPRITPEVVQLVATRQPLSADARVLRLMRYLVNSSSALGEQLFASRAPMMAWAECGHDTELFFLEDYLKELGWVKGAGLYGRETFAGTVTVDGYRQIADESAATTNQAFVAMWFDHSTDRAYSEGIETAVRDCGYTPLRIDRKEHINKIEDEIIAEIRRSRFVVADFTQGGEGARGGVYYEAGFAHGLGIPVILSCQRDCFKHLHFDTNHYNHIDWIEPEDLRLKLKNRILAVLGAGPTGMGSIASN
ncbi:MAG: hypothetical protein OXP37_02175 [Chloroflexota bacterium]|nr:hypothetical protein [Chloroflexota bacterium]